MRIELPKRVAENIDRFAGRTWLLPRLLNWWDSGDERLFLLIGDPGTGKSLIQAWLAGFGPAPQDPLAAERLGRLRRVVKAAYFCQASSRNITPAAFAESMANQLTNSVTGFTQALAATLADRIRITTTQTIDRIASGGSAIGVSIGRIDLGTLGDDLSFDRVFTQPLKALYASGYTEPILILVDGIDEAQIYTGQVTLPYLLSRLVDFPAPVRILATTRDEPRVLKLFRNMRTFDLVKDADSHDDVRAYAEARLARFAAVPASKCKDFARRLSSKAEGVFLYAAIVLDELLKQPSPELPNLASYPLPEGMSGLYHDFLTRELGRDEQRWFDLFEPLLGLIAVAQGEGLTAQQLTAIIGRDIRLSLRTSKQYLSGEIPDGPFRPFHKSFADFLLEDKSNLDYHIDAAGMHKRIAEHFWSQNHSDWTTADKYALAHMSMHLGLLQAWPQLKELLLDISFVRPLSDLSNKALADGYRWSHACLEHMSEGPPRRLLLQLSAVVEQLRLVTGRAAEMRVIESFLGSQDQQHMVVVGPPGTGKSSLAALVWVRHFDQCLLVKLNFGDSLFTALTRTICDAFVAERDLQTEYERLAQSAGFGQLIEILLRHKGDLCLIVDELDAVRSPASEVEDLLLVLPQGVRVIWFSRPIPDLANLTREALVVNIAEMNQSEIMDLCRQRLGPDVSEDLLEQVATLSNGSPLYLNLVAREIELRGEQALYRWPQSLSELYDARLHELETSHPGIRKRLASLVGTIIRHGRAPTASPKDGAVQFDVAELNSMERSGLFTVEYKSEGTFIGVVHASLLDFFGRRCDPSETI